MLCYKSTLFKLENKLCMTSNFNFNLRCVDDNNARTITSLASSPPVVSGVTITAATMALSLSTPTTSSLSAGTALRSALVEHGAPPAMCSSAMADGDDDDSNNGGARDVASPTLPQPSRADNPHPPPRLLPVCPHLDGCPLVPPCFPGRIVLSPGEVERRVPPHEGVVGAVV